MSYSLRSITTHVGLDSGEVAEIEGARNRGRSSRNEVRPVVFGPTLRSGMAASGAQMELLAGTRRSIDLLWLSMERLDAKASAHFVPKARPRQPSCRSLQDTFPHVFGISASARYCRSHNLPITGTIRLRRKSEIRLRRSFHCPVQPSVGCWLSA